MVSTRSPQVDNLIIHQYFNLHFSAHHVHGTQSYTFTHTGTQDATESILKGKQIFEEVRTFSETC